MRDELSQIERTRLALWALSEAEVRITTPQHVEAEVMRAWDALQAERSRRATEASIVSGRRFAAAVAKWVVAPAMAAGMGWAALRGVPPVASSPPPGPATVTLAGGRSTATLVESPAALLEPASPVGVEHRAYTGEALAPEASVPSRRPGAAASAGASAVVFVGELVGAGERIQVVRMRVPRSTLVSLGISVAEGPESVFVDLLVGEDGVARALQVEM
jgi:hypothetical protein